MLDGIDTAARSGERCLYALVMLLTLLTIATSMTVAAVVGFENGLLLSPFHDQRVGTLKIESAIAAGYGLVIATAKSALPTIIMEVRRHHNALCIEMWLVWLATVAYCSGAAIIALVKYLDGSGVAISSLTALLAAGWFLFEMLGGMLPMIARLMSPAQRVSGSTLQSSRHCDTFGGDVAALLDHLLINGAGQREGLAVTGPGTIICTQSALADHAGCSKTDANRQLWRLQRQGQIGLMTNQRETRIQVGSTPLPCLTPGRSFLTGTLLGTPPGTPPGTGATAIAST